MRVGSAGKAYVRKADSDRCPAPKKVPFTYQGKRENDDLKEVRTPGGRTGRGERQPMMFTERLLVPFKGTQFSSVERKGVRHRREMEANIGFTIKGLFKETDTNSIANT